MNFKKRNYEKELLDQDNIPSQDLFLNLKELDIINKRLGGYNATLSALKEVIETNKYISHILDLGFGGGDSIKQMAQYCELIDKDVTIYGVDLKQDCIDYAKNNLVSYFNIQLICNDYRKIEAKLIDEVDLVHCSLFLHHLKEEEIISLIRFCLNNKFILIINDLHRHWLAYYSIKVLTYLFSKSYLVKNDAPLSVLRGFKKSELIDIIKKSGVENYSIKWSWAFRYKIIIYK